MAGPTWALLLAITASVAFLQRLAVAAPKLWPSAPSLLVAAQTPNDDYQVTSPRPLGEALFIVERRCGCVVTYEDPAYDVAQVEDWTSRVRRDGKSEPKVLGPPESSFTFSRNIPRVRTPSELRPFVDALVDSFNRERHQTQFRVEERDGLLHVVPASGSLLAARVTMYSPSASLDYTLHALVVAVHHATGKTVGADGATMQNLLLQTTASADVTGEVASTVLARLLATTGRKLSRHLLYDFNLKAYMLNVYSVE